MTYHVIPLKNTYRSIFVFVLLLQGGSVLSQNATEADSLIQVLGSLTEQEDSFRFEILKRIAFSHPDPARSLSYAQQTLTLARKMNQKINIARALEEVCLSERVLGNKIKSFEAAFEALRIYDELHMRKHQAVIYIQIGGNYVLEKEFERAVQFLLKGRKAYLELKNIAGLTLADINIGEAYRLMNKPDSAEWYFMNALRSARELNNPQTMGYAMGNLGMVYYSRKAYKEAQSILQKSITLLKPLGDVYSISVYTGELGRAYFALGDKQNGILFLEEALNLAFEHHLKEQVKEISFLLFKIHKAEKQYQEALHYHQLSKSYEDSLINLENVKAIEQLNARYTLEKKDKEIAVQQAANKKNLYERNITLVVSGFLAIIIIISTFAYLRKQRDNKDLAYQRNEIAAREHQKQLLLAELQHRTKNNLQMISSLLSLQSRKLVGHPSYDALRDGQSRVDALAAIHQRLYQEGSKLKINLHDYLIELVTNIVYGSSKNVNIHTDIEHIDLEIDKAVPLALIVNELVTNALKHAFITTDDAQLTVRFKNYPGRSVVLDVEDNGRGVLKGEEEKNNSFGFRLIHSLVDHLNATIKRIETHQGCHWRIKLPEDVTY